MINKVFYTQQSLQACVHIAIVYRVFKTYDVVWFWIRILLISVLNRLHFYCSFLIFIMMKVYNWDTFSWIWLSMAFIMKRRSAFIDWQKHQPKLMRNFINKSFDFTIIPCTSGMLELFKQYSIVNLARNWSFFIHKSKPGAHPSFWN